MRARHRHFNPRDCDALVALDSRYGFTVADGSAVDPWDDRSRNNNDASTTTAADRPTYETNELNGRPVVKFNSNDILLSSPLSTSITSNALTCLSVSNKTGDGTSGSAGNANNFSRIFSVNGAASSGRDYNNTDSFATFVGAGFGGFTAGSYIVYRNSVQVTSISGSYNTPYIHSFTIDGTSVKARLNNSAQTTGTTSATALNATRLNIGYSPLAPDSFLNGDVAMVTIIRSVVSDALRKRLEHAAAFSFKISCN
jgi:hypothetical protein